MAKGTVVLSHARHAVRVTAQLVVLAAIGMAFFLRVPQVTGPSMLPDVRPGEVVLINTLAYRFGSVARGDVVAFDHVADATDQTYIKRVVALGGEQVRIDDGVLSVDGKIVPEPYVSFPDKRSVAPLVVPAGSLYLLGDNRAESEDSRAWGPVPQSAIIGKAVVGVWPPGRLQP